MVSDLGKRTVDEVENDYCASYRAFYDKIIANELTRAKAVRTAHNLDEMCQFFPTEAKVTKLKIWGFD